MTGWMEDMPPSRRRFLQSLVTAPLVPAGVAAPQPPPTPTPTPPAEPTPIAEALAEVVKQRYGAHLEPGDLEEIKKGIEENLRAAARLRARKLTNADEPVTHFRAQPPTRPAKAS